MRQIIALFLLLPVIGLTQVSEDFGLWSKINLDYNLNKSTSINSKTELRTNANSSNINQLYTQISIDKKVNKKFYTSFAWRPRLLNKEYNYIFNNRFHNDLTYKEKIGDLSIYFRLRTQYNFNPIGLNDYYERTRIKLKYKFNKKISSYIYNEFYFLMNDASENSSFNKNRFGVGLKHMINSKLNLQLKYLRIRDVNVENPILVNIIGVGISIDI
jgi:hypothetical protein